MKLLLRKKILNSFQKIILLLKKDFLLEWRQKYSIYGLILYITSAVFAIKMLQDRPEGETWNVLFWIILLFVSINAVAKSFLQESKNRNLYYYTVHHPRDIIISKLIYNVVMMLMMSFIGLFLFVLLLGDPIVYFQQFLLMVITGGISLSLLFTTLAAIAGKAGGNSALIAILGFPVVIPQIILLSDLSKPLFVTLQVTGWWQFYGALILLDFLIIVLSIILFPFIWKE
ncbi:MAG: heme exporter protein CcmB [Bacteroidetes bacterium]|nr:heme exporter protein CcmB [Bacteroidota bacterium]MBK9299911.1 heme exporter protein CcmB [Bacteroidota bacterium]MBK9480979.1 heme exporter protein CcmB [Bacteroidota bacterium]